jgi:hypothetical protein
MLSVLCLKNELIFDLKGLQEKEYHALSSHLWRQNTFRNSNNGRNTNFHFLVTLFYVLGPAVSTQHARRFPHSVPHPPCGLGVIVIPTLLIRLESVSVGVAQP